MITLYREMPFLFHIFPLLWYGHYGMIRLRFFNERIRVSGVLQDLGFVAHWTRLGANARLAVLVRLRGKYRKSWKPCCAEIAICFYR
jgi:hypothetical protein